MQHRRALRFAGWACALMMLMPCGLGAQTGIPPQPVPAVPEASLPPPGAAGLPVPIAVAPPPPPVSFLDGVQQRRQQRFQHRQERRHHMTEKAKSLFGLGT